MLSTSQESVWLFLDSWQFLFIYNSLTGRDWGQEEKGTTEDEMAGLHHWLYGREFEWTPGDDDGQGGLACCNLCGHKESDMTERLNWTELNWTELMIHKWHLNWKRARDRAQKESSQVSQDAGEDSDSSSPLGPRTLLKAPSASSCCFSCSQRGTEVTLWGNLPIPNAETVVGEGATSGKSPKQVTFFSGSQLSFSWADWLELSRLSVSRLWPWSQPSHQLAFDLRQVLVPIWIGSSFQFFALNTWMGR